MIIRLRLSIGALFYQYLKRQRRLGSIFLFTKSSAVIVRSILCPKGRVAVYRSRGTGLFGIAAYLKQLAIEANA